MTRYHAVMEDECGGEFGAEVAANTRDEAYELLVQNYPESKVIQLENPQDTWDREKRMHDSIAREMDGDEEGW